MTISIYKCTICPGRGVSASYEYDDTSLIPDKFWVFHQALAVNFKMWSSIFSGEPLKLSRNIILVKNSSSLELVCGRRREVSPLFESHAVRRSRNSRYCDDILSLFIIVKVHASGLQKPLQIYV